MCGIAGLWNLDDTPLAQVVLEQFTRTLAHRGPDGEGFYRNKSIGLGHRRLAILDLSETGKQPMSYASGRYWITFNGEIYNFLELRKDLESHGHRFVSDTDTEVILAAYAQWGEDCQLKFNGMWAFAIWDNIDRSLFLSRDRFGVKPLHYLHDGRRFAFASEMKAFLALPGFTVNFEPDIVANTLIRSSVMESTEHCLLRGLKRLPGGHCLSLREDRPPQVRRWWRTLDHLEQPPADFPQQCERYRELFLDACRIRMRSDVPVATALSGGLDSSSVLCGMTHIRNHSSDKQRLARDWQRAFVATYPGTIQDERSFAEMVIQSTGATPVFVEIDSSLITAHLDDFLFHFEEIQDIHLGPWMVYRAMRQHGVVVSMDGHGGDEALAGYEFYPMFAMRDAIWRHPKPRRVRELYRMMQSMNPNGRLDPMRTTKNFFKRLVLQPLADCLREKLTAASPAYQVAKNAWTSLNTRLGSTQARATGTWLKAPPPLLPAHAPDPLPDSFDNLDRQLYRDFHVGLLPAILRNFDRCSMAHGVEIRAPFMDWRLVCYAFSLPSASKLGNGFAKLVLREAMRGILPEHIRTRRSKVGFSNPLSNWLRGPLRPFILDTVASRAFLESDIWNGAVLRQDIENAYQSQNTALLVQAWPFINAVQLMALFAARR